jgi:hypothetical protein
MMFSTSCYKERLNFENILYIGQSWSELYLKTFFQRSTRYISASCDEVLGEGLSILPETVDEQGVWDGALQPAVPLVMKVELERLIPGPRSGLSFLCCGEKSLSVSSAPRVLCSSVQCVDLVVPTLTDWSQMTALLSYLTKNRRPSK